MALDERYITDTTLEPLFVDKLTGLPLAGGYVYFWQDNQRNTPKPVYQLTGAPPNYTYTALPNPIQLSAIGTFQNNGQDNIAVYYYPYDANGEVENYYIQVFDSSLTPQFTREAWPNVTDATSPANENGNAGFTNQLSNPQFVDVLFNPTSGLTISYSGTTTTTQEIAPNWFLEITHAGGGSVTVTRENIAGTQNIETQPPYTLTVTAGANISSLKLYQRLTNNPDIWSSTSANNPGYIASSITLANSSSVKMYYRPNSTGTQQLILDASNNTGAPKEFRNTTLLEIGDNPATSSGGYVDIVLELSNSGTTRFTSVQVVGLKTNEQNVAYDAETVNRQKDHLFHYYNPILQYKPIPSYLVGWDFGLNPKQFGSTVGPIATGANKSFYAWDQTIIFQKDTNGVIVSEDPSGGLRITAQTDTQFAVIQYLGQEQARELLSGDMSVGIRSSCNALQSGVVSLWATTDVNLPDIKTPNFNSIVATLNADGSVATQNGAGWVELTRKAGKASFNIILGDNEEFISGWTDNVGTPLVTTAKFFAIVVGFNQVSNGSWINLDWVSLNAGKVATRPAPQTPDQVLRECQRYYEMSYATAAEIDTVTSVNAISFPQNGTVGASSQLQPNGFDIFFNSTKRVTNPTVMLYSPQNAATGGGVVNVRCIAAASTNEDIALAGNWTQTTGNKVVNYVPLQTNIGTARATINAATPGIFTLRFHYTADARFGVVN